MKKTMFILIVILGILYFDNILFKDTVYDIYEKYILKDEYKIINNTDALNKANIKENKYGYKEYNDDVIHCKDDLVNKLYTIINNGYENYTFYCGDDYTECFDDINKLNKDKNISHINDFVNTYNKYNSIKTYAYQDGKIDLNIYKLYDEDEIKKINNEIDDIIIRYNINNYSDINTKIKLFHDYIVYKSSYDENYEKYKDETNLPNKAIGPLFNNKGVCSGYTDLLAIFLDKINVENYKISNEDHIWNLIKINDNWLHIDMTFDDPVTSSGQDVLLYDYFMITTDKLASLDDTEHNYDTNLYNFIK